MDRKVEYYVGWCTPVYTDTLVRLYIGVYGEIKTDETKIINPYLFSNLEYEKIYLWISDIYHDWNSYIIMFRYWISN